jgi:hypothetical protein
MLLKYLFPVKVSGVVIATKASWLSQMEYHLWFMITGEERGVQLPVFTSTTLILATERVLKASS